RATRLRSTSSPRVVPRALRPRPDRAPRAVEGRPSRGRERVEDGPVHGLETVAPRRYNRSVQFRILGPLEAGNGHGRASVEPPKLRTLLGVLLLHPNEVVSSERLIDELWGERPPASAPKLAQT